MKRLQCEICGSNELRKDGGVFVCQACGCQYTVEEARKMMVEGVVEVQGTVSIENTVDVQGTVMVDNASYVEKYLANARRTKEKQDWEEVERYYNLVEQNDPDNIEAIFYSSYGKAMQSLVESDIYKREAAFKVFTNSISIIDDHYLLERREENREVITMMAEDLGRMVNSNFVYKEWKNGYGDVVRTNMADTFDLFSTLVAGFKDSIDNIQRVDDQPHLHRVLLSLFSVTPIRKFRIREQVLFQDWISEEQRELESVQKEFAEKYWLDHPEEKAALIEERVSLKRQLEELATKTNSLPGMSEKNELERRISLLEEETGRLPAVARRARRGKQAEMADLKARLTEVRATLKMPLYRIDAQRREVLKQIEVIDERLATAGY